MVEQTVDAEIKKEKESWTPKILSFMCWK